MILSKISINFPDGMVRNMFSSESVTLMHLFEGKILITAETYAKINWC
jgi:hypothetical protein